MRRAPGEQAETGGVLMDAKSMQTIVGHLDSVICGDNATVMATFPDACIDLVVTSPPYDDLRKYGGHSWDFPAVSRELTRILKPGGVIVWVVRDKIDNGRTLTSMRQAIHFKDVCGLNVWDTMIWDKPWCQYGDTASRYAGTWEYMHILSKGRPKTINLIRDRANVSAGSTRTSRTDRRVTRDAGGSVTVNKHHVTATEGPRKSIWVYHVGSGQARTEQGGDVLHPAIFPEGLARDHIFSWSNPGDVVLDPFAGSGTTLKMAKEHGRRWIGIEVNPAYVEICRKRVAQGVLPFVPNKRKMESLNGGNHD
jgi:site-specific DNA-methyltransferase (adenine-specific)